MAYHIQSSFGAGELDPALHERTTFEKYKTGLKTLRNAYIGKTGRIISRSGHPYYKLPKLSNKKCIIFAPEYSKYIVEWGHEYVRIHDTEAGTYSEDTHNWTESDLDYVQMEPHGDFLYLFRFGKKSKKMVLGPLVPGTIKELRFLSDANFYYTPSSYAVPTFNAGTGTGHLVEYMTTVVSQKGEESLAAGPVSSSTMKMPINNGEFNQIYLQIGLASFFNEQTRPLEMRVYRRPAGGNAFGYVGSTSVPKETAGMNYFEFIDYGVTADYTHSPPSMIALISDPSYTSGIGPDRGPIYAFGRTGCVYQQRLLITEQNNEEAIYASRTGFFHNFTRDYPYGPDSALALKAGTSGNAKVLRMVDYNGFTAFTTVGIYQNNGALSPDNLALEHKGNWVIDETVPPLKVPGGLLFVDKATNTVRLLVYSNEAGGYPGQEVSIFSNHFFVNKKIKSWAFQEGDVPLVWVVLDDGSLVSLTYQREHQMQAWARHDTEGGLYESVTVVKSLTAKSTVYFVVKRGSARIIEKGAPRFVSDLKDFCGVDCGVTFKSPVSTTATFTLTPVVADDWEGQLTIVANSNVFTIGDVGKWFKYFDEDGSGYELFVNQYIDATTVKATPSQEFPSSHATLLSPLYRTTTVISGLDHLEGKSLAVFADGYVVASPNNDQSIYTSLVVTGGSITLPKAYAIVHAGLPITSDWETLNIDTVEQKPSLLESIIIHKLYLSIYNTRGLFIGSAFPKANKVTDMHDIDVQTEDLIEGIIGNAPQAPETKRHEFAIPNDWKSNGRICGRQVDPLPYEILSIIPDLTVAR